MFRNMVHSWFAGAESDYNDFIKALLAEDIESMHGYTNRVTLQSFRYFETGKAFSFAQPERFYHGFALGLMVDLRERYYPTVREAMKL